MPSARRSILDPYYIGSHILPYETTPWNKMRSPNSSKVVNPTSTWAIAVETI